MWERHDLPGQGAEIAPVFNRPLEEGLSWQHYFLKKAI